MNDIPGALFMAAVLVMYLACARTGPGFRAWARTDKINYLVMAFSAWPWLILGFFINPLPHWYTVTVWIAAGASFAWFLASQLRFLRESRRTLHELDEHYQTHLHPDQR